MSSPSLPTASVLTISLVLMAVAAACGSSSPGGSGGQTSTGGSGGQTSAGGSAGNTGSSSSSSTSTSSTSSSSSGGLTCPASMPVAGQACTEQDRRCGYGSGACPIECTCTYTFASGLVWECPTPAGPACGSTCPTEVPAPIDAALCDGYEGRTCRYNPGGCGQKCFCEPSGGYWHCSTQCACGDTSPPPAACTADGQGFACRYGYPDCATSLDCTCSGGDWTCLKPCDQPVCPGTPKPGDACDIGEGAFCVYPLQCTQCTCAGGVFACEGWLCDKCPDSAPATGEACDGLVGQVCGYPAPDNKINHCECTTLPDNSVKWGCNLI